MTARPRIGILGGTLDPIHIGHIESARAARAALALERVLFVPSRVPPHRPHHPSASGYHRFAMAALAVDGIDGLEVSDLELSAPGPSYTADTLERLHAWRLQPTQIFFITGADAFAEIATWSRYPRVLDLAHFVVVSRPGHDTGALRTVLPSLANRMLDASIDRATANEPAIFLVNARTPDVSSTDIRRRLASGEPLNGMVPAGVEHHIRKHRLYSSDTMFEPLRTTADHLHGHN